jgi:hypothetical protein
MIYSNIDINENRNILYLVYLYGTSLTLKKNTKYSTNTNSISQKNSFNIKNISFFSNTFNKMIKKRVSA